MKRPRFFFYGFFAFLGVFTLGYAEALAQIYLDDPEPIDRYLRYDCHITPQISTTNYPGFSNIMSSNKLAFPPGKSILAEGQIVYFFGRVFDQNCVPVTDAKIEFWHANPWGKYRFANKAALATPDPVFSGAGRVYTDNLGEFLFVTIYPGPYQYRLEREDENGMTESILIRRAPHYNLRITHPYYPDFATVLYFANDRRNDNDHRLLKLPANQRQQLMMSITPRFKTDWNFGVQAYIDLFIPGQDGWDRF